MRKSIPILVCMLGIFFFIPFINFTRAAPPSYIGVQVGEEYTWTIRINANTFAQFAADMNESVIDVTSMFESMGAVQLKGEVSWISDEIFNASYSYVIVNVTIYMYAPGVGWIAYPDPSAPEPIPIFILSNNTSNYFNSTITASSLITLEPPIPFAIPYLIVPKNLNWTDAVQGLNDIFQGFTGGMTGGTIAVLGNGFKITIPEQLVNGSLVREMQYIAQWNDKGVFSKGQVLYGGATLISVNVPEGEIPGYELVILLGVLGITATGIMYYIRKRK